MSERDEKLERLIGSVLRVQPLRQAPAGFEARVLGEIERRAALPWWHKSFAYWPQLARVTFLIALLGVARLALQAFMWLTMQWRESNVATAIEEPVGWFHTTSSILESLEIAATLVVSSIPPQWLSLGLILGAALYVALFGVGAAVYRTLNK